jgi:hypothetical protein
MSEHYLSKDFEGNYWWNILHLQYMDIDAVVVAAVVLG